MRILLIFGILLMSSGSLFSQTKPAKPAIESTVFQLLQSDLKNTELLTSVLTEVNQAEVGRSIGKYFADSTQKNRVIGFQLIKQLEKKHKGLPERAAQVDALFTALEKLPLEESKPVFGQLIKYSEDCFKESQISLIRDYLALPKVERKEAMLLLGFLGEHSDIDYLQSMTLLYPLKKDQQFYLNLALIRLGDSDARTEYLTKLETMTVEDEFVINNLQNAIYTKDQEIYKRLLKEILNDDKNCSSANNDDPSKIPCAYRIIEAIAPHVKDFPVKINRIGEIEGNPTEELLKAQKWIGINLLDFQINTSIY